MKIAIYVQDMRASGVVRTMLATARVLTEGADAITVLAGYRAGVFGVDDVAPADFVAAAERPGGRLPRLTLVPKLRRTLRALRPDVVLSGGNFGHFSLWAATRGLGLPIVYVFSNEMERAGQPWRNRWRRFWSGLLIGGSARSILVGSGMARSATFRPHLASGRAVMIRNGIDLASVPAPSAEIPAVMAGRDPVVLAIGRLQPQKNFAALIEAIAVARTARPLRLVVLGTGDEGHRHALLELAEQRGIADSVTFAGVTDNVFPWLRAARVFALPSRWEGSSIALLEALAAGTPVVVSRTAGDAADVLADGRYGLLVDPADANAFAAALLRQIDDPVVPGERVREFDAAAMVGAYHQLLIAAAARSPWSPGTPPIR